MRSLPCAQHTDLHPGNILVRVRGSPAGAAQRGARSGAAARTAVAAAPASPRSLDELLAQPGEGGKAKNALQLVRGTLPQLGRDFGLWDSHS